MPGYSGTPLAKKLGIKDSFHVALLHVPDDVKAELRSVFAKCQNAKLVNGQLDFIFLFVKSHAALEVELVPAAKAACSRGYAVDFVAEESIRRRY